MSLPELTLTTEKNQRNVQANRLTVRESEKGLTLVANIVSGNGLPYDLTGLTLQFCENKQDGKAIIDPAVSVLDSKNGRISYVLHSQAYACSGSAWFEILNGTTLVDSTQNFSIKVESTTNVNVDSSDYIGNLEALRQQLQTIVDGADASLKSQLASFQTQFNNKLSSLQSLYTAAESKRNTDWQTNKASINSDWQTLKTSLNSQISSLQTLLNNVQTQVDTLNNTTLLGSITLALSDDIYPEVHAYAYTYGAGVEQADPVDMAGGSEVYDIKARCKRVTPTSLVVYVDASAAIKAISGYSLTDPEVACGGSFAYLTSGIYGLAIEVKGSVVQSLTVDQAFSIKD